MSTAPPVMPLQYASAERPPFMSPRTLATVTVALLAATLLISLVEIGSTYAQVQLLQRAKAGQLPTPAEANSNDMRQAAVGIIYGLMVLGTAIPFLMWVYRVDKNVMALGERPRFTPKASVWWFFAPIFNIWRPYQILSDIWEKSSPNTLSKPPSLVSMWWGLWVFSGLIERFAQPRGQQSLDGLIAGSWASIVATVVSLGAGFCAIAMLRAITQLQVEKFQIPSAVPEHVRSEYIQSQFDNIA